EKPLCLSAAELDHIASFYADGIEGRPLLMTGFNRRFSPHAQAIAGAIARRSNPLIVTYRGNAGYLPPDTWVHGAEGGGRNIGEACHFYDLFVMLTNTRVDTVTAKSLHPKTAYYSARDNFAATVAFEDGSLATLTYTSLGSPDFPKEQFE